MSQAMPERTDKPRLSDHDLVRLIEGAIAYNNEPALITALGRVARETDLQAILNQYRVVQGHQTYSFLTFAAKQRFLAGILKLLECGAPVEHLDGKGFSYLHYLARQGNFDAMAKIFDVVRDERILNTPSCSGHTPLQLAVEFAPVESVHETVWFLLQKRASPHLAYQEKALPIALLKARAAKQPTSQQHALQFAKTLFLLCSHGAVIGRNIESLDLGSLINLLPDEAWVFFGTTGYAGRSNRFLQNDWQLTEWLQVNAEESSGVLQHVQQAAAIYFENPKARLSMPPHVFKPSSGKDMLMRSLFNNLNKPTPKIAYIAPSSLLAKQHEELLKFGHALLLKVYKQSDATQMPAASFLAMGIACTGSVLGFLGFVCSAVGMTLTKHQGTLLTDKINALTLEAANNTAFTPGIAESQQQLDDIPKLMLELAFLLGASLLFAAAGWLFPLAVTYERGKREEEVIGKAKEEKQAIAEQIATIETQGEPSGHITGLLGARSFFGVERAIGKVADTLIQEASAAKKAM